MDLSRVVRLPLLKPPITVLQVADTYNPKEAA